MFEGKVIDYKMTIREIGAKSRKKTIKAIVVSCIKDIGITIVRKDNPKCFLYCMRMKNAPEFYNARGEITKTEKAFSVVRKQIIAGVVDEDTIPFDPPPAESVSFLMLETMMGKSSMSAICPFK